MTFESDQIFTCGKCKKNWDEEDFVEQQECLYKRDVGGYGSVFGDGQEWSIRLCQNCAMDLLKQYIIFE